MSYLLSVHHSGDELDIQPVTRSRSLTDRVAENVQDIPEACSGLNTCRSLSRDGDLTVAGACRLGRELDDRTRSRSSAHAIPDSLDVALECDVDLRLACVGLDGVDDVQADTERQNGCISRRHHDGTLRRKHGRAAELLHDLPPAVSDRTSRSQKGLGEYMVHARHRLVLLPSVRVLSVLQVQLGVGPNDLSDGVGSRQLLACRLQMLRSSC